eukprot:gene4144-biopygen6856
MLYDRRRSSRQRPCKIHHKARDRHRTVVISMAHAYIPDRQSPQVSSISVVRGRVWGASAAVSPCCIFRWILVRLRLRRPNSGTIGSGLSISRVSAESSLQ